MAKFNTLKDGTEFIYNGQKYRKNRLWKTAEGLSNATRRADTVEEIDTFIEQGVLYKLIDQDKEVTVLIYSPSFTLN